MRLERERQQREAAEAEALRRTARQEEMRKGLELAREAAETEFMSAEDARSAIAVRSQTYQQEMTYACTREFVPHQGLFFEVIGFLNVTPPIFRL